MGDIWNEQDELERRKKAKKKKAYIITIAIISIICLIAGYFMYINSKVKSWENKIYKGVTINGLDVSGKTKDEAKKIISSELISKVGDKSITLSSNGESVTVEYKEINPSYKIDEAIEDALNHGKTQGVLTKNSYIKNGAPKNVKINFGYDKDIMDTYLKELNSKVVVAPKNATLKVVDEKFEIIPQVNGIELNLEETNKILNEEIDCNIDVMKEEIELPTKESMAKVTDEMLSEIDGKIGSASTRFNPGDWSRTTNLKVATGNINGTVLMPGQEFSYNEVVGERTVERGFKPGAAFEGKEVVQTIGGGVCQISTTLYQAITKSGILPTERYNHTMPVTYAEFSEDATVAWGYLDYKFKNTYDTPIFIEGIVGDGIVTFNVYGNQEDLKGYTYDLVGMSTGGGTSKGYFVTYKDDKEVDRVHISSDVYQRN